MKTLSPSLAIGLAGLLSVGTLTSRADLEVSAGVTIHATADFHEPLTPHGSWVEVDSYGRCWRPTGVAVSWRPYVVGHWEWTDCGWYWVSDEPWAWACYHYGSWVHHSHHGWVWVPGIEWAPAWVTWRTGGGYVGWAPLPPHRASVTVVVGAPQFVFVESKRFHERHTPKTVIVNNTKIINETTVINNIKREDRVIAAGGKAQKVVINEGPGIEPIQKATGKAFKAAPIREVADKHPAPAGLRQRSRPDQKEQAVPTERRESKPDVKPDSRPDVKPDTKPDKPDRPDKKPEAPPSDPEKFKPNPGKDNRPPSPPVNPGNPGNPGGGKGKGPDKGKKPKDGGQ